MTPVVYLSVPASLATLVALREQVLRPPLVRPASHPFVPHVTVADELERSPRPRRRGGAGPVVDVRIESLHLLRARPRPGSVATVAEAPFTPPLAPPAGEGEG